MKKAKIWLRGMLCMLLAVLMFPAAALARTAADTERPASLTIECAYDGRGLPGVAFDLYKVADMDAYGRYTLSDAFRGYAVSLEQDSAAGWRALAGTLAQYARRDHIPADGQAVTGADGQVTFTKLRAGIYLAQGSVYTEEDFAYTSEPLLVNLPGLDENDRWQYEVRTKCKGEAVSDLSDTMTVRVRKVWKDKNHESGRPAAIKAQLLRGDRVYDTVTLDAKNGWSHTWKDLSADHAWSVVEETVPKDYTLLIQKEGAVFVLINQYDLPSTDPAPRTSGGHKLPQTGQLWWPIPVLGGAGLMFYLAGILIRRRNPHEE